MSGPEFGPEGYLPPKASARARKIVLREQMGSGWPLAALAASVLVLVAGGVFLFVSLRAPGDPYMPVRPLTEVPANGAAMGATVEPTMQAFLVRAGGGLKAFHVQDGIRWCPRSRRIESDDAAWTIDGQLVYGELTSLQPLRTTVHDGVVYVDFSTPLPKPPETTGGKPPVCTDG